MCFSLLSVQCLGIDGLLKTVFPIVTVLATKTRQSRSVPYVDCAYPLVWARKLESIGVGHLHQLQKYHEQMSALNAPTAFSNAVREYLVCAHTPALSWKLECGNYLLLPIAARMWGSTTTASALWPQHML